MSSLIGRTLGPFEVLEPLGSGGMAAVYRATDVRSGLPVALKTVHAPNPKVVRSIRREVHALSRLRHPGIVRIVGDGVLDGVPWYAMELIEGVTLGQLSAADDSTASADGSAAAWTRTIGAIHLAARAAQLDSAAGERTASGEPKRTVSTPRMPVARALGIVRALCPSLAYLHGEGLVHRDLKPDNIVLREDGEPVLVDFGLASLAHARTGREALDVRTDLSGTAAYIAPEVIRGEAVDARADLYAVGCILYELLTGTKPFAAFTVPAVLRGHLETTPAPPSRLVPQLSASIDALVMGLLEKEPRNRVGHADDIGRALDALGTHPPPAQLPEANDYLYRPSFAGRRRHIEALDALLREARGHAGKAVYVGGESGIGKTRLVNEIGARAARTEYIVLEGICSRDGGTPLSAFDQPLERIADHCRAGGPAITAALFGRRAPILAPYHPPLASLPGVSDDDAPAKLAPDAARLRVFRAMAETLHALSRERPVLLILDDLQWADRLTLDLLALLSRELLGAPGFLIIATYRVEEAHEAIAALFTHEHAQHIVLDRLEDADIGAMVEDMLAHGSPTHLGRYVASQAEGNPFFVAEYLRAALEAGLLRRDEAGRWGLREGQRPGETEEFAVPLPSAVRELVLRRLDRLTPDAATLTRAAAILGREVNLDWLLAMTGLSELDAFDAFDELSRRHVLEDAGLGRLRFTHDKLREVSYGALDPSTKRQLHREAAQALRTVEGERVDNDDLARHYVEADMPEQAVEALHLGAAELLARSAWARAARGYRQLLRLSAANDQRRASWERALGEALLGLGETHQGQRQLLRALSMRGAPTASNAPDLALGLARELSRQVAHRIRPTLAGSDRRDRQELLSEARAYQRLVETYFFDNDMPRMLHSALHALNLAERAGPSPELVSAYGAMTLATGGVPLHSLAEHYADLALSTAEVVGDPAALLYAVFVTTVYRIGAAKWSRVDVDVERALALATEVGDTRLHGDATTICAMVHLYRGGLDRAAEFFDSVADAGRRFDNLQHRIWADLGRAEVAIRRADFTRGQVLLDRASSSIPSNRGHLSERLRIGGLEAQLHLGRGDLHAANEAADRTETRIDELMVPTAHYMLEGYAGVAAARLAALASGADGAERDAARAVRRLDAFARIFRLGRPRAAGARAQLLAHRGKHRAAERARKAGLREARRLGMPLEPLVQGNGVPTVGPAGVSSRS